MIPTFISMWLAIYPILAGVAFAADEVPARASSDVKAVSAAASFGIQPEDILKALPEGLSKVEEFRYIRELAKELGLRVYLYGGSASAMVHYQRWDLERARGSKRLPDSAFDYDTLEIFRPGQDIDLAVDGSPQKAAEFESRLAARYPRVTELGRWEVRPLRQPVGSPGSPDYKPALLNDPDFALQNNDTGSIGAVELSSRSLDEPIVRDLTAWEAKKSRFLQDASAGKITFLRNPNHANTARAKAGSNPEILAVIRYLTKISQYNLQPSPEDLKDVKQIIKETPPVALSGYPKYWLDRYAPKLVSQSADLEMTFRLLKETGLGSKLAAVPGVHPDFVVLLQREPLASFPVGGGDGRTSAEIAKSRGVAVLEGAHDSHTFDAMESILRGHFGRPNAFISRRDSDLESASRGNGFYAVLGKKKGAWSTGFTTRFELLPEARERTDFIIDLPEEMRLLNSAAARITEYPTKNADPKSYFKKLHEVGQSPVNSGETRIELAYQRRSVVKNLHTLSDSDRMEIRQLALSENQSKEFIKNWVQVMGVDPRERQIVTQWIAGKGAEAPSLRARIGLLTSVLDSSVWLESPEAKALAKAMNPLIDEAKGNAPLFEELVSRPGIVKFPEQLARIFGTANIGDRLGKLLLEHPHLQNRSDLVAKIWNKCEPFVREELAEKLLTDPAILQSEGGIGLLRNAIESGQSRSLMHQLLKATELPDREALIARALRDMSSGYGLRDQQEAAIEILKDPVAKRHPEWVFLAVRAMSEQEVSSEGLGSLEKLRAVLINDSHWSKDPALRGMLSDRTLSMYAVRSAIDKQVLVPTQDPVALFDWLARRISNYEFAEAENAVFRDHFASVPKLNAEQIKKLREIFVSNQYSPLLLEGWLRSPVSDLPELADLTARAVHSSIWEVELRTGSPFEREMDAGYERFKRRIIQHGSRRAIERALSQMVGLQTSSYRTSDYLPLIKEARAALESRDFRLSEKWKAATSVRPLVYTRGQRGRHFDCAELYRVIGEVR